MKIVIITGSPRKHGNSSCLADEFQRGAIEAGHEVFRFNAAFQKVESCIACNHCGMNGDCVQKDDFALLRPHLIDADVVVFATPIYYYGFSAQLKKVIDRFYAINGILQGQNKRAVLLVSYASTSIQDADYIIDHYRGLIRFLGWENGGEVVAKGVWDAAAVKQTEFPEKAYLLGKSIA